jgi:hypothetical protein
MRHETMQKINDCLDDGMDVPHAEANALMSDYNRKIVEIARLRAELSSLIAKAENALKS